MKRYNRLEAEEYMWMLIKKYKIRIRGWNNSPRGTAWCHDNSIRIPKPSNLENWAVCLHEIKHIIQGNVRPQYVSEFNCEQFAIQTMLIFEYDTLQYQRRSNWYIMWHIAKAHNKGKLDLTKMPQEIRNHFSEVDFESWDRNQIKVHSTDDPEKAGYYIINKPRLSQAYIGQELTRLGLELVKARDFRGFIVKNEEIGFGKAFSSLDSVADYFFNE